MNFRNAFKNPKRMVPIGTLFLAMGILIPMFLHPASQSGKDWLEGARGFVLGFAITIMFASFVIAKRQRQNRCAGN